MPDKLPKISIVTPSFQQAQFLEETIQSVLNQNYPNLEYIVMDGGSTDGSADIIRKHQDCLAYWTSSRDGGQYDAINQGFAHSTGEVMAWLNSDDKYTPWALSVVGEIFAEFSEIEWLTTLYPLHWDEKGRAVGCGMIEGFSRETFFRGEMIPAGDWYARDCIQQESTFWRRSLWDRAGGKIDTSFSLAGDFELWARFYKSAELYAVGTPLGGFRVHGAQKTATQLAKYMEQANKAFFLHGGKPPTKFQSFKLSKLSKLLRFLERKYDQGRATHAVNKRCLFRGGDERWRIKSA